MRSPDLDALLSQAQEQLTQVSGVLANVRTITEELKKPEGGLLGTLDALPGSRRNFRPGCPVTCNGSTASCATRPN